MKPVLPIAYPATESLSGGGEMAELIRALDWSETAIGGTETWSPALRITVQILLANRFPQLLWWGPDYISIYNDAYRPILGRKHPWGLGKPVRECWSEIWSVLKPLIDTPFRGGASTWIEDLELEIHRTGFTEETHFTVAYSPVPDDRAPGGIGGVLATVHEITEKVVGERRIIILGDLGTRAAEAKTAEEACAVAAATLAKHPNDIPFALLYVADLDGSHARLAASCGFNEGSDRGPLVIDLNDESHKSSLWPLARVRHTKQMQVVENLSRSGATVPAGPWSDPPHTAVVLPIRSNIAHQLSGFLVAGVSSRLRFDDGYKNFLEIATSQIATAVTNARAYEEERRRAEGLAEIDRAKTVFFSNVSHEFRTPLTLMLGPIESVLSKGGALAPDDRDQITIAHRNGLRLLKLVNSLLDFSRIEAGRANAVYTPVDLAALTADLASNFRSALQAAGLEFVVDCPPLPQPVYVDREMWEKIVLNLLSNGFKFTFEGRVIVRMETDGDHAVLTVADTGTGIPEAELPHIFKRFHRVEGARGRTHEGTGIGLATVHELVNLHRGTLKVESRAGEGSAFTITLPFGRAHLPQDRVFESGATSPPAEFRSDAFIGEAMSWMTHASEEPVLLTREDERTRPSVLVVDDNAEMRQHISRTLGRGYQVIALGDGIAALEAIRLARPDIVLADVMMPKLDGFAFLQEVRADPTLRELPVILISARAGEEARIEGITAGADDYLTKPFSANELVARVETTLNLQRIRREALEEVARSESRFRAFVTATSDVIYLMSADWSEMRYLHSQAFIPDTEKPGGWLERYIHPDDQAQVLPRIQSAIRDKIPFHLEHQVIRADGSRGWTFSHVVPVLNPRGEIVEWFGAARDISAEKEASERAREAAERLRFMAESMPQKIFTTLPDCKMDYLNSQWTEFTGLSVEEIRRRGWIQFMHPDDVEENSRAWSRSSATGEPFQSIHRFRRVDGRYRWHLSRALPMRGADGKITMWVGSDTDIHDQKEIEEELRRANQDLEQFAYSISHDLQEPLRGVAIFSDLLARRCSQNLDGEGLEFLENVRLSASRLEELLRDLSAYTQASSLALTLEEESDANEVLQAALANLAGVMSATEAKVDSLPLPVVHMARTHLQQLFQNLVGNAIKYQHPGVAPLVHVTAKRQKEDWLFAVSDNGIGIDPKYKETIFGLFKRLHTKNEYSGTGVGLAICERIVARYHGRIWVESEAGKGSTFFFRIPAAAAGAETAEDSSHPKR